LRDKRAPEELAEREQLLKETIREIEREQCDDQHRERQRLKRQRRAERKRLAASYHTR
jgi:hypothetical protein